MGSIAYFLIAFATTSTSTAPDSANALSAAIAELLAAEGANVIINGRTSSGVDKALKKIKAAVPEAHVIGQVGDLSKAAACAQLVATHPHVDILVNNLGIFDPKPFESIADDDWQHFFETNEIGRAHV